MHVLKDWSAKRAGARITITGKDTTGATIKVGTAEIKAGKAGPTAIGPDGTQWRLA